MKGIKIGIVGVCVSLIGIAFAMNSNKNSHNRLIYT